MSGVLHYFNQFKNTLLIQKATTDGCGQEGFPVAACITMSLEKPLVEETVVV